MAVLIAGAFLLFSASTALAYDVKTLNDTPGAMPLDPWTVVAEPLSPLPGWEPGALVRQDEWVKYGRRPYAFVASTQRRYDPAQTPVRPLPSRSRSSTAAQTPKAQTAPSAYVPPRQTTPSAQPAASARSSAQSSAQSPQQKASPTAGSTSGTANAARVNPYTGAAQEVGATLAGENSMSGSGSQGGAQATAASPAPSVASSVAPVPVIAPVPSPRPTTGSGTSTAPRANNITLPDNNGRAALQIPPTKH